MSNFPVSTLIVVLAGAICTLGFAPFYLFPLSILALVIFFYLLSRATSAKSAAWLGFSFGLGLFNSGIYWIYISLHDFGGMPPWMAALSTFALNAFLSLLPALAGWLAHQSRFKANMIVSLPLLWTLTEWVRSWIFTGFPWLSMGYSQVPHSPLSGYAPVFGLYGVTFATALVASLIAALFSQGKRIRNFALVAALFLAGGLLKLVPWTHPVGTPTSVALLQGNISQDIKWEAQTLKDTLDRYYDMVVNSRAQLIIMPETALPLLVQQIPAGYLDSLAAHASKQGSDVLAGVVELEGEDYYNSMLSIGASPQQVYRKSHLVPFGEFIPFKSIFGWIYRDWLNIPLTDLSRGSKDQRPMDVGGQRVAMDICYEDVFGAEIIRQLPEATLLANTSNDAWYGESTAAYQHLQIAQMRAIETGRMMVRSTNTGATAIINPDGTIKAHAPHFLTQTITGEVQGYQGATPYVRFGDVPILIFMFALLGLLWHRKKQ